MNEYDYFKYELSFKEKKDYIITASIFAALTLYLFYRSLIVSAVAIPLAFFSMPEYSAYLAKKKRDYLLVQFRDFLYSVAGSVSGGRHMSSAIREARENLAMIYEADSPLAAELTRMTELMDASNESDEELLKSLAARTGSEDISNFTEVYYTARDAGADLASVVNMSSSILIDKMQIKRDIAAYVAQKKYEGRIIALMPPAILLFMNVMSAEYLEPLYTGAAGRIMMTAALLLVIAGYLICEKITDIEVSGADKAKSRGTARRIFRTRGYLRKQEEEKKRLLLYGLPDFLNELVLLMTAGMVLSEAVIKIAGESGGSLLQEELRRIADRMKRSNSPVIDEFRAFAAESGVRELIRVSNILRDNVDKGSELTEKLSREADLLWHQNLKSVEESGRIAESRLTFPMSMMLVSLLIITGAPAFMLM